MPGWEDELERWLMPFLDRLGHKTRQRMCPLYVAGLIGPGDRKSVQPMAERLATGKSCFSQPRMQPLRQRPSLQPDPLHCKAERRKNSTKASDSLATFASILPWASTTPTLDSVQ